jgi:3-oxoadipate enol-lactonase
MTETFISVDGGEVWADDSGGGGLPLVLLHPGTGDSRIWEPILPSLTPKYRVIRHDARGWGKSPAPLTKFSLLPDLVRVLDHYGIARAPIVGCSQGGASALGIALEQPERVPALVLLSPGIPGFPQDEDGPMLEDEAEIDAAIGHAIAAADAEALAGVLQRVWGKSGATPEAMEQLRSDARAILANGDLEQEDPPVFDRLAEISVPTALVVGDADYPPLVAANKQAAARIPGCEFTLVPGMDHLPPLREPDLVLRVIISTLGRAGW